MTNLLAAATIPDAITFAVAAMICVVGALGVVLARNPVHSALMLVMTLFGIAVLFIEENAQFLAAVQVIVYAGAIVVLFLFVIMLLGVDRSEAIKRDPLPAQRPLAVILGILGLVEVLLLARGQWPGGAHSVSAPLGTPADNVQVIGKSIFTTYLLAFEVTSALLVVAVVGAVVLVRRPRRPSGQGGEPATILGPEQMTDGPQAEDPALDEAPVAGGEDDDTAVDGGGQEGELAGSEVTGP
ncbi:MAG: NADH-quinone oxidoreductase subunit J [Acidimicrobiales bacterium]|jgi:NADH-quinone oxidoreductase subunit J